MTRNEVFPGKYLKADDLKGKACVATIESAPYVTLKGLDGNETKKIVLHFKNAQKTLPLNATNFDAVCDATGFPDTEDWPGQRIELYPTRTTMGGNAVPARARADRHARDSKPPGRSQAETMARARRRRGVLSNVGANLVRTIFCKRLEHAQGRRAVFRDNRPNPV